MPLPFIIAWALGLGAFAGLVIAAHRGASARTRLLLVLVASAALLFLFTRQWFALLFLVINVGLVLGTWRFSRSRGWLLWIGVIVLALIISKLPSAFGKSASENPFILSLTLWIGFSYLAFRLIHFTVDAHMGRIGHTTLEEFLIYTLHPSSLVAGPIDRIRPNVSSQRELKSFSEDLNQGLWRILIGAFTKFVIANPLFAFISAHDMTQNPNQPIHVAWMWLITYSFYLLSDFASYTHLAIGFGRLAGISLPENFDRPYLSASISLFWQRWHMTLSFWLRDYIFFPLARDLRTRFRNRYRGLIQFICHITTMGAAGLWHGLSGGFLMWGLWHGFGLFVHGQFAAYRGRPNPEQTFMSRMRTVLSVVATYAFVTLGWVFFAADLPTALRIYGRLFGIQR